MIERKTKNYSLRPVIEVCEILNLNGCKMFSEKLLKLKGIHESHSKALDLKIIDHGNVGFQLA